MEDILMSYQKIHENPLLFSALAAIILSFLVILTGICINFIQEAVAFLASLFVDPWLVCVIINYLFFPGVMLHECAHALLAVLTGAKVTEVALFKREGNSLGHVNFRNRGNWFLVSLQNIFISSAPMFVGAGVIYLCQHVIRNMPSAPLSLKIFLGYLGISMCFHMTMSPQDVKVYIKGIPIFAALLFLLALALRLTNMI